MLWFQQHIMIKETYAILEAIWHCPPKSTLRIWSDSQTAIATIAKGVCKNSTMSKLVDLVWKTARRREVQYTIKYVRSESNPADKPSRKLSAQNGIPHKQIKQCLEATTRI